MKKLSFVSLSCYEIKGDDEAIVVTCIRFETETRAIPRNFDANYSLLCILRHFTINQSQLSEKVGENSALLHCRFCILLVSCWTL